MRESGAPGAPDRPDLPDPVLQILDGVQYVPRERVQNLVGKQIVDVPVSKILVEIVEPVAYRRQVTARVDVHFPVPQIQEKIVEVIKVILREQPLGSTSTAVCCASSTSNSSPADDGRGSFFTACSYHGSSRGDRHPPQAERG